MDQPQRKIEKNTLESVAEANTSGIVVPFETKIGSKAEINQIYLRNVKSMARDAGIEELPEYVFELYAKMRADTNSQEYYTKMGDQKLFAEVLKRQGKEEEIKKLKTFYKEIFI